MAYAEKHGWIENAAEFVGARKLRNLLVHEYMSDTKLFLEAIQAADGATQMLFNIVNKIKCHAETLGIIRIVP